MRFLSLFIKIFLVCCITSFPSFADEEQTKGINTLDVRQKFLVIGTGNISGIYYTTGSDICRLINRDKHFLSKCIAQAFPGPLESLTSLRNDEIDFAIVQSDWQRYAVNGSHLFDDYTAFKDLRSVLSLHDEAFTVIVRKNSNITSFKDLKNKKVDLGAIGSGVRQVFKELAKFNRISYRNMLVSDRRPYEQAPALCSGAVDAVGLVRGHPNSLLQEVSNMCDIRLISLTDAEIATLTSKYPEFSKSEIEPDLYRGIAAPTTTVSTKATLVTTARSSEQMVNNLLKVIFYNIADLRRLHPVLNNLEPKEMAQEGHIAPLHPGAIKYYIKHNLIAPESALATQPTTKQPTLLEIPLNALRKE
jgi:TRAP transporter TAXI family solute receptor